jgi:hypothetical protein
VSVSASCLARTLTLVLNEASSCLWGPKDLGTRDWTAFVYFAEAAACEPSDLETSVRLFLEPVGHHEASKPVFCRPAYIWTNGFPVVLLPTGGMKFSKLLPSHVTSRTEKDTPRSASFFDSKKSPHASRPSRFRRFTSDWWSWEISSIALSLGCSVALIVILNKYDSQPVPQWRHGITVWQI